MTLRSRLQRYFYPRELIRNLISFAGSQSKLLEEAGAREAQFRQEYIERSAELIEARQMAGSGPWLMHESRGKLSEAGHVRLAESVPIGSVGAFGDIELALQNVEWRREVNLSWLEFSRWGIQQIILISRLYFVKNPLIQRGINVASVYVFGRGVEVSSPDERANEVLRNFFERNKQTLGQIGLVDLERRKYYDGNLFFCFFPDKVNRGEVNIRTIDATEIMDIVTDPNDTDTPHYYRRQWTERGFTTETGAVSTTSREAWYPALGYDPSVKPKNIGQSPVMWDSPVLHRKCGGVAKWQFGCPLVYAALDWAKAAKTFLESCATVRKSLAQIAMTLTTKGGQQALEGFKQQLQTTVGPGNSLWDTNPPAVDASIFASGPGTKLEAFNTKGAGGDPEEVRRYILMVCAVFGFPETFYGDVQTGNLATATSLDRPTELNFMEKQEAWREDLCTIAKYVLKVSMGAPSGMLRESAKGEVIIRSGVVRERVISGTLRRIQEAVKSDAAIEVAVNFPAIREGDLPALVDACVKSITLDASDGAAHGIDEKAGIRHLMDLQGFDNTEELVESMYPEGTYEPDRAKQAEEREKKAAEIAKQQAKVQPQKESIALDLSAGARKILRETIGNGHDH